ncbi:MAG TPA: cellulose binding domain-containing protein, partial [Myxococcota bacterium]
DPVDPVDPGPNGGVSVFARETNRWNTGACFAGDVDNASDGDQVWSAELLVEGTVNNHWNSVIEDVGNGRVRFSGAEWNASLPPGSHADVFGFCVEF